MFIPQSGNNEFIEIYNLSETDSFDLNGYKFKYYTSNTDVFIDAGFGTILHLNLMQLYLKEITISAHGIYAGLVPPEALI
jgi:hypothetical protein